MTLIKSISGIRGIIGGKQGEGLTPPDVIKFTRGFARWALGQVMETGLKRQIVVGRDARISGPAVEDLVVSTLVMMGIDVIKAGLATTPTVEMAVSESRSMAGIILTASHNPAQWNALKLLNQWGEFLSSEDGTRVLELAESEDTMYASVHDLGKVSEENFLPMHISRILALDAVDVEAIRSKEFRLVVDPINSVGAIAVPALLEALGVEGIIQINQHPDGNFAHNPEPLPQHLVDLSERVVVEGAHMGISVDPDVDRLALVCEDGSMFGEEYTLVAVADYLMQGRGGHAVSNLSSSRALRMVAQGHGGTYSAAAVGEVNVVAEMKRTGAIIGGEGNGGVILPALHYGRDALAGLALFLSHLAHGDDTMTTFRAKFPSLYMDKIKVELGRGVEPDRILEQLRVQYEGHEYSLIDGLKVDFEDSWVHIRKSNTEPIMRVYTEAGSPEQARLLSSAVMEQILSPVKICSIILIIVYSFHCGESKQYVCTLNSKTAD